MKIFDWNEFKEKKIAVEVLNEEECREFLKECKKNNLNWIFGEKVANFIPYTPTAIVCNFNRKKSESKYLGYSRSEFYLDYGYEIVKWSDIKNNDLREEIIIYRNGNEVIALHKENGETVKSAKSKCNTEDEFNFNVGAKLAFERLVNNNTKDDLPDFKIGEFVEVTDGGIHYFPIGSVVEIKKVDKESKELRCYGYTNCFGSRGFNEQVVKFEDVEKISN